MSRYEQRIKDGAKRFLEDGEDLLAAVIAAPRGYTQQAAVSIRLGSAQRDRAHGAAAQVDLRLKAPTALAITQRLRATSRPVDAARRGA